MSDLPNERVFRHYTGQQVYNILHAYRSKPRPRAADLAHANGMTPKEVYTIAYTFGATRRRRDSRPATPPPLPADLQLLLDAPAPTPANPIVLEAAASTLRVPTLPAVTVDPSFSLAFQTAPNNSTLTDNARRFLQRRGSIVMRRGDGTWTINGSMTATDAGLVHHANRQCDRLGMPPIWVAPTAADPTMPAS